MNAANERRSSQRLRSELFRRFDVELRSEDVTLRGRPADVSEQGLGLLMLTPVSPINEGAAVQGAIIDGSRELLQFQGRVTRVGPYADDLRFTVVGVEFDRSYELPDQVIAVLSDAN